jgi:hypothetical protein
MALKITRGRQKTPIRAVIYGTEGAGKTTLVASFPAPVILDTEDGSSHIDCARVACHDWLSLEGAIHELVRDPQGFETVVIDSADWMERSIIEHMLGKFGKKSIEDFGFGKGYVILAEHIGRVLNVADQLIAKGINVVFVAHAKVQRTSPPDQTDGFDRYELKMTKQSAPLLKEWCDLLLFCTFKTKLVEGADGRVKATGGKERVMYAERTAAWDAKNRFGLPEEMPMSIEHLARVFAGPAKAASNGSAELFHKAKEQIASAAKVDRVQAIEKRLSERHVEGALSEEHWSALADIIDARYRELTEMQESEAANA